MGLVTFSLSSTNGSPVVGASVSIVASNGITEAISATDDLGQCIFDLTVGQDYYLLASHADHVISTYKIKGLELGVYDVTAIPKALKVSDDPNFCLVQGTLTNLVNVHLDTWSFNIMSAEGYTGTDDTLFYGDTTIKVDKGRVEFSLVGGVSYIFSNLPFCEAKAVYVPKTRAASLVDLVSPVVTNIEGVPLGISMATDSSTEFDMSLTLSNTLSGDEVDAGYIEVEVSDPDLISASISSTYKVSVISKSTKGNAEIRLVAALDADNKVYSRFAKRVYSTFNVSIE